MGKPLISVRIRLWLSNFFLIMKICKNDSEIILYPVSSCSKCAINRRQTFDCLWFKIVGTHSSMNCSGIRLDILSDIFKL